MTEAGLPNLSIFRRVLTMRNILIPFLPHQLTLSVALGSGKLNPSVFQALLKNGDRAGLWVEMKTLRLSGEDRGILR